jgi:hypothetical protein
VCFWMNFGSERQSSHIHSRSQTRASLINLIRTVGVLARLMVFEN